MRIQEVYFRSRIKMWIFVDEYTHISDIAILTPFNDKIICLLVKFRQFFYRNTPLATDFRSWHENLLPAGDYGKGEREP
jgi:hypothetical protein